MLPPIPPPYDIRHGARAHEENQYLALGNFPPFPPPIPAPVWTPDFSALLPPLPPIPPPGIDFAALVAAPRDIVCDTECYRDYWLAAFTDEFTGEELEFEMYPGGPELDRDGLARAMRRGRLITFNGRKYDEPMIAAALAGYNNDQLKQISDDIIQNNRMPWQIEKTYGVQIMDVDHVDIFDVAPGAFVTLKDYGGRIHSQKIQDLPIEPSELIGKARRPLMRQYCKNDRVTTTDLRRALREQIEMREVIGRLYGLELRSKSDAQIAEMVFKKQIGFDVQRPYIPHNTQFQYTPPTFINFQTEGFRAILAMLARSHFTVSDKDDAGEELDDNGVKIKTGVLMPPELKAYKIQMGTSTYQMGIGGLHSTEKAAYHVSDATYVLGDDDVVSYYPWIMINNNLYPQQYGPGFIEILKNEVLTRMAIKKIPERKIESNGRKIIVNSVFGKTGSKWSTLFAPDLLIQTTITGQLCLLMLIEAMELGGISVVSANTDGIVTRCRRDMLDYKKSIIKWWEGITKFETENAEYKALFSRDVNNYIAFKTDGSTKTKGAFKIAEVAADGSLKPDLQKNPTGSICVEAVIAYLGAGVPIPDTIRACQDVRKFVHTRKVKGGGMKADQYLGKVVRWYYAIGEYGAIHYAGSGNRVAKTLGARPLMELCVGLPADLDHEWYVREAYDMLADLGLQK